MAITQSVPIILEVLPAPVNQDALVMRTEAAYAQLLPLTHVLVPNVEQMPNVGQKEYVEYVIVPPTTHLGILEWNVSYISHCISDLHFVICLHLFGNHLNVKRNIFFSHRLD